MDRVEAMRCLHGSRQKQQRLDRIRAAKAALEAEVRLLEPSMADSDRPGPSSGMQAYGRPNRSSDGGPPERAQRNFTDPDSRILPTRDGFIAGYNGQFAVDAANQIIVSHRLITNSADVDRLIPLVDAASVAFGRKPIEISAENGFASEANLQALAERRISAYFSLPTRSTPQGAGKHLEAAQETASDDGNGS